VCAAAVGGIEEGIEVALGVEYLPPDERVDRVGELCSLFVGQTVGPERRPEPVVVDVTRDGVGCHGECTVFCHVLAVAAGAV
jgi:hypothetical protein